ncbi:MAG: GtrA family protein [Clostridia bacterium]|nr:GtrA family protein [Clostridia bacterium]
MKGVWKKYREGILYLLFGGLTTLLNWLVYALLVTGLSVDITAANAIAWVIAVLFAFVTNKRYVFRSEKTEKKALIREIGSFFAARVLSGMIEVVGPTLLMGIGLSQPLFGIPGFLAKLTVSVVVVLLNYLFSKWFIFKK